ncbi:MAG: bifunctional serine/threonine-protein kinase/formylglycine-generating enzyme family protein [Myxococcota bacterium]
MNEVVLGGRYRLENLIGRGASSIVYRAHDTLLSQDVAIKVLRRDGILSQEQARALAVSLRNETRMAMRLAHPNVLRVHHYEQSGNTEYLVMELATGENLHQLVQRRAQPMLSTREVVVFGLAVLFALEHAHAHGVIHNDLKPANILLCRPGGVKVCDFGLAQQSGTGGLSSTVAGTPAFMSPERIRGLPGDARSDLYSMAATFFTLGTGRTPFGDRKEAIGGHLEAPVPRSPLLPDLIQDVIARAMAKDPADRYQSARAMVVAWEEMAQALAVEAPSTQVGGDARAVDPDGLPTEPSLDMPPRTMASPEPSSLVTRVLAPDEARRPAPDLLSGELPSSIFRAASQDRFVTTPSGSPPPPPRAPSPSPSPPAHRFRHAQAAPTAQPAPPAPAVKARWLDEHDLATIPGGLIDAAGTLVAVRAFQLERAPVTNEAYARFLAESDVPPPSHWSSRQAPRGREQHPVVGITRDQARAYAHWRGRRLPTDAEWVPAYGGPDGRRFPWGDAWRPEACVGRHNGRGEVEAVGNRASATPEGCTDLLGNVWEWTDHDPRYEGPEGDKAWVFGGSFRHACDAGGPPRTAVTCENDYDYLGFRCAVDR